MNKPFYDNLRIGILGGGQLGRMFIQEALNFNLSVSVMDADEHAPCKTIVHEFVNKSYKDVDAVLEFGRKVDLLTIEIEHVNVDALVQLEKEGLLVYPQPEILKIIQDKGLQKDFYKKYGIPTADYFLIDSKAEIENYRKHFPFMQKLRKGGYDGKGVTKLSSPSDIKKAFDAPSILEKVVDIKKEISVIVARNVSGEIKYYPPVELDFHPEANLVEFLFSPADLSDYEKEQAISIAYRLTENLRIVGLLAVEMFITKTGEVLVNEIAPRPHNSGHQTIEGNLTSQYEQHLRAILNLPLGSTQLIIPSVMVNLLGAEGYEGYARYEGLEEVLAIEGVHVHLYGKRFTKPFRKMGHITIVDPDMEVAKQKARIVKEKIKVVA